ncbi:IS200/IS605 family transposase [Spirosoma sp. BT702]|uniref:IS200/IS605 family transposase n=1 Tax=Spirosoma profusum TaxID=2771354 RepID=A0A926XVU7_9BACT|nr:IS200/IS605 family transposase [Spirosoma profusum]MBD2701644.1 IS200/IS605 family transposase [Spirosoma profusum]
MDYRTGSHSRYELKIHLVWITKYRKRILKGDVSIRLRELIREICKANEVVIVKGHISSDHVHLLLSYPPTISVSKLVQYLKGKRSRKLLSEYDSLSKAFWGQHLWARGYFAASVGTVTDEVVKEYIDKQDVSPSDDDFKISD